MTRTVLAAFLGSFVILAIAARNPDDVGGQAVPRAAAATTAVGQRNTVTPLPVERLVPTPEQEYDTAVAPALPAEPPKGALPATGATCPRDMALVEGDFCTETRQTCARWLDDPKLPFARCAQYEQPARCVGKRVHMRYCIDKYEYTRPGETLPMNYSSFMTASKTCKEQDKRVCTESEWMFACEGEEMRPYPYGWSREPKCNQDQPDLYEPNPRRRVLKDLRQPSGSNKQCVSPFGVYDMVGNMDEPVLREEARYATPFRNGLKGGWWMSGRNRCRPATTAHDDYYSDIQVGVRCCSDLPGGASGASG